MDHTIQDDAKKGFFSSRANIVLVGFLTIAGFLLITEHRTHLVPYVGYLPFLLLLACPLMHLFMHHDHGEHKDGINDGDSRVKGRHEVLNSKAVSKSNKADGNYEQ